METLNFEKILAYYQRNLPQTEEKIIEEEIFSHPEYVFILLGLKKMDEEFALEEELETFLEKNKEAIKKKIFPE